MPHTPTPDPVPRFEAIDLTPPAFPHAGAIFKQINWGLNLNLFCGGGNRLTARGYKAYMGYLLVLLLVLCVTLGSVTAGLLWLGFIAEFTWAKLIGFLIFLGFFTGVLVILQNAFRAFMCRLHDFGLNGWWFVGFYVFAFILDGILSNVLDVKVSVVNATLNFLPFILVANSHRNQYGFPVEYRWYSFPAYVRWGGEGVFWLSALSIFWAAVGNFIWK